MSSYYFKTLYSGSRWLEQVRLTADDSGLIVEISENCPVPAGVEQFGPAVPGMANVHSHAFQRVVAGLTELCTSKGEDFWSWREKVYRTASALTPGLMKDIAAGLYLEMLKAGYTSVGEFHYLHHSHDGKSVEMSAAICDAARLVGLPLTHLPVLYEYAGFGRQPACKEQEPFIIGRRDFMDFHKALESVVGCQDRLGVALHSLRAVDASDVAGFVSGFSSDIPVHIHVSEQVAEVKACRRYSGMRPVQLLASTGVMGANWTLVHATHLSPVEMDLILEADAVVGLCPTTEANLGDGIFPAVEYMARGGKFGIGSDSHVSVDPREELRLLEYSQRLVHRKRALLTGPGGGHNGECLWREAARAGAQSLGQNSGVLEVGKRADLIVLEDSGMTSVARRGGYLLDTLVFAGQPSPVRHVMTAGNWVVSHGRHALEAQIEANYRAALASLGAL